MVMGDLPSHMQYFYDWLSKIFKGADSAISTLLFTFGYLVSAGLPRSKRSYSCINTRLLNPQVALRPVL